MRRPTGRRGTSWRRLSTSAAPVSIPGGHSRQASWPSSPSRDLDAQRASASSCASTSTCPSRTARSSNDTAHRGGAADHQVRARQGRLRRPDEPPRPPGRPARSRSSASSPWPTSSPSCSASRSSSSHDCVGPEVETACAGRSSPARSCCSRTSASTSRKRARSSSRTAPSSRPTRRRSRRSARALTKLGDVYVNDAFGTAHRAHSSMAGVKLPQRAAGFLMKKELDFFGARSTTRSGRSSPSSAARRSPDKIDVIKQPARQGRRADHRRRHGLHLQQGAGHGDRQVARRAGPRRDWRRESWRGSGDKIDAARRLLSSPTCSTSTRGRSAARRPCKRRDPRRLGIGRGRRPEVTRVRSSPS